MEFCYVLGMSLSCSSEVYILTLNDNKSHRYTCVCVGHLNKSRSFIYKDLKLLNKSLNKPNL